MNPADLWVATSAASMGFLWPWWIKRPLLTLAVAGWLLLGLILLVASC